MYTPLCERYGIDVPVFAFSHSPAVVAAVSNAGGLGVLGAARFDPETLDQALSWIARQCPDTPYGVDLLIPATYAGDAPDASAEEVRQRIPDAHRAFVDDLLRRYQVPPLPSEDAQMRKNMPGSSYKATAQQVDIALSYPIRLLVSALGVPSADLIERAHRQGAEVGALVGMVKHALAQKAAGVDFIVAQGSEAGGHTGQIATMVLAPQVVDAVASIPVLAAGGIADGRQCAAALALGAQGVWTGSVWLMTEEAETSTALREKFRQATSSDTLRSRARTGKPARQLRSAWTDAWEDSANPQTLPMPLQGMLVEEPLRSIWRDAEAGGAGGKALLNYFVGQVVGMLDKVQPAAEVLARMTSECDAVLKRMSTLNNGKEEG